MAATVIDTVPLARNLLQGRAERTSLASLAFFFGTAVRPCHRALADAQATAEVFVRLIEIAQERGASTVSELEELAAPRPRRIHGKRHLVQGAPSSPGVYLFRDRDGCVLYVGKARDLRARLRTYFQTSRQRPTVEQALDRLERVEWRETGCRARRIAAGGHPDPRAPSAREHAHAAARTLRLPAPPRRARRRQPPPVRLRPSATAGTGAARGPCTQGMHERGVREPPRGRAARAAPTPPCGPDRARAGVRGP